MVQEVGLKRHRQVRKALEAQVKPCDVGVGTHRSLLEPVIEVHP
jgi:hypothetical protein